MKELKYKVMELYAEECGEDIKHMPNHRQVTVEIKAEQMLRIVGTAIMTGVANELPVWQRLPTYGVESYRKCEGIPRWMTVT